MRRLAAAGVAGCLLSIAVAALASGEVQVEGGYGGGFYERGKVRTDGTLTVGGQETLYVKKIPLKPKLRLVADVYPAVENGSCFNFNSGFCLPEPLFRVPGTPKLKANRKGRAKLTFVMPAAVQFDDFKDPLQSHPVPFVNGESVQVDVEGTRKVRNGTVTGPVAVTHAIVEVPPAG